jgi:hypothetical protein
MFGSSHARLGGTIPPQRFTIWKKPWYHRLARQFGLIHPSYLIANTTDGVTLSEEWQVAVSAFPGQDSYYFEDEEPTPNHSNLLIVSSAYSGISGPSIAEGGFAIPGLAFSLNLRIPLPYGNPG